MAENPMAPPGMHLCRFCGSIVPEAQYRKNHPEAARKAAGLLLIRRIARRKMWRPTNRFGSIETREFLNGR
jgi:hypothetical protein